MSAHKNFIELIENNGYIAQTNLFTIVYMRDLDRSTAIYIFWESDSLILGTNVQFIGSTKKFTYEEAKEYFIKQYIGDRKIAINNDK